MRICLFCNETAGEGVSAASLVELITRAGHHVERVPDDIEELRHHLNPSLDCVVAAGGDGTVAKVGRALAGGDIPLAIFPLGTANNIAGSLAINGTPAELIEKWPASRIVRIDVGVIHDATGTSYFLESVGTGLVAAGITTGRAEIHRDAAPHKHLEHARRLYVDQASRLQPEPCVVTIEGHEMQGPYLAVEILNTPAVGPGIRLSADVNAADGFLSVVVADEADRGALVSYLQAEPAGHRNNAGLKAIRAERVELSGARKIHVDDEVREFAGERIAISVKPGWLAVLA
jgi:diacylglycerol kinase family enzyme